MNFLKAGVQSGTLMLFGDVICQAICRTPSSISNVNFDKDRAYRMGIVGLTLHGPYMYTVFTKIDAIFGSVPTLSNVVKKVSVIQLTAFPLYLCLMFGLLGVLEGREFPQAIVENVQKKVPQAYIAGCVFWPVANMVAFRYIATPRRVVYLASVGIAWNTYISYMNNRPIQ